MVAFDHCVQGPMTDGSRQETRRTSPRSRSSAMVLLLALTFAGIAMSALAADRPTKRSGARSPAQQPRTWTDASGKHRTRATLVEVVDGSVKLKKTDGKTITVPIDRLSEADKNWLEKHKAAAESAAAPSDAEWPGWLGPNRDGKSPDTGLLKQWPSGGPRLVWKTDILGHGFSSVAVSGGTVYIAGEPRDRLMLYAFDMNGALKWKTPHGPSYTASYPGSRGSPTVDGKNIYLLSGMGLLGCFDAQTGKPKWTREAREFGGSPGGWGYAESPLILGDLLVFKPGGRNCVVALDKATGRNVWGTRFDAGPEYSSCLAVPVGNDAMIVTGTRKGLIAVDARNGALLWGNDFSANNTANCPTPAYSDGHVFWANGYNKGGICLTIAPNGAASQAWTTKDMNCHHGGYVIHKGCIYGNNDNGWACLDLKTGQKKWEARLVGKGSLCWADDMLYLFGEKDGQCMLTTCAPEGVEIKNGLKVDGEGPSWAHPVVVGGRLYLRYDTNLYCFDVKTAPKTDDKEEKK